MKSSSQQVIKDLKSKADPKRAKSSAWFFKTGKGEYGYGDVFWGIKVPEQRKIVKKYPQLPLKEVRKLLQHKVHECRLTALFILVLQYKKANDKTKQQIVKFYLANTKFINNWDLVDSSALYILGDYLLDKDKSILYKLVRSKNLWQRRIAVLSTFAFIKDNQYKDAIKIEELLLKDNHDLIHKAVGWMLREIGKRSQVTEEKFLNKYAKIMPRTMLRYAIEKFSKTKRSYYLK